MVSITVVEISVLTISIIVTANNIYKENVTKPLDITDIVASTKYRRILSNTKLVCRKVNQRGNYSSVVRTLAYNYRRSQSKSCAWWTKQAYDFVSEFSFPGRSTYALQNSLSIFDSCFEK